MQKISDLYLLVHPDYQARADYPHPLHPYQQELRTSWEKQVKQIDRDRESALFYISPLDSRELAQGLRDPQSLTRELDRKEIHRIERWKDLLDNRMVVFSKKRFKRNEVQKALKGFTYDADDLRLHAFGEYQDLCVRVWKEDLRDILELQPESVFTLDRLSMTLERGNRIRYSRSLEGK